MKFVRNMPLKKTCTRCGVEKDNNTVQFNAKISGRRDTFDTTDVCKDCKRKAMSDNWAKRGYGSGGAV